MPAKEYTYVGAMEPAFAADKFVTSIFRGEDGRYYTHEANGETINKFNPITLPRPLSPPRESIHVTEGAQYIYTFQTVNGNLLSGARTDIEKQLVPLIRREQLDVHVRLIISSFLRFYQKTLDLIEDYNATTDDQSVDDRLSPEIVFVPAQKSSSRAPKNILEQMISRFDLFRSLNPLVRLEDIAYLKKESAYFIHHKLDIAAIANPGCLNNDLHNKTVSRLIMYTVDRDGDMINVLYEHNEVYEFIIGSQYLELDQKKVELPLTAGADTAIGPEEDSVLETVIRLDKELYNESPEVPSLSGKERRALETSMRVIIGQLK